MTSMTWLLQGSGLVAKDDIHRFVKECLIKCGALAPHAHMIANIIVDADCLGHKAHGFNRLELYLNMMRKELWSTTVSPVILSQSAATAWVDGRNALGPIVGNFCMQLAIEKALKVGVGIVCAKGSNQFGICSHYSTQAFLRGLIGFCCSNTLCCLTPTRAAKPFLGTNPLSVAAPSLCSDAFVLDMSTAAMTLAEMELQYVLGGGELRDVSALDSSGQVTRDTSKALDAPSLLPLGGLEETGGYKGSGLAFMVEALCGILAGGAYGVDIKPPAEDRVPCNLSQCFIAIDPRSFTGGFESRLFGLCNEMREMEPMDPTNPVLVPGDREAAHRRKVNNAGGISYHSSQLKRMMELAEKLDIKPVTIK